MSLTFYLLDNYVSYIYRYRCPVYDEGLDDKGVPVLFPSYREQKEGITC